MIEIDRQIDRQIIDTDVKGGPLFTVEDQGFTGKCGDSARVGESSFVTMIAKIDSNKNHQWMLNRGEKI